jgi:hypothetical protein
MALRTICGRTMIKRDIPTRSFHVNMPQGPSQHLAEWFSEKFSAQPDSINTLMNLIYTQAPHNSVTPFNLICRSAMERWTIKGLRVGTKERPHKRSVVVASGVQAYEHIPIGVALYVAAVLSRRPIHGVEVTFFPILKPKEFELQWHNEQTSRARSLFGVALQPASAHPINLSLEEHERGIEGPLRSYALKRATNFVDVVMDLANTGSRLHLKQNSLARSLKQASSMVQNFPSHPHLPSPKLAGDSEQSLFDQLISPPTIILELRDRNKLMDEDQIVACGEEVVTTIHKLIEETDVTRVLL